MVINSKDEVASYRFDHEQAFREGEKIRLRIFRYDPARDSKPRYDNYEVPYEKGMRIMGALDYLVDELGQSIAFRSCCGMRRCGACAMMVNGKPKLACWDPVEKEMTIEPLRGFPVIRDLIVDRSSFDMRIRSIPPFQRLEKPEIPEKLAHSEMVDSVTLAQCIECFLCIAACSQARDERTRFLGPAEAGRLASFTLDPRDKMQRSDFAYAHHVFDCVRCFSCKDVCPIGLEIPTALSRLQQMVAKSAKKKGRHLYEMVNGLF